METTTEPIDNRAQKIKDATNNNTNNNFAKSVEDRPNKQKKMKLNFNADVYKRLNFLHQAAMLTLSQNEDLSRFYMETMKSVAQRNVIRL